MDKSVRRSTRKKTIRTSYSPPPHNKPSVSGSPRKKPTRAKPTDFKGNDAPLFDLTPDGQPFSCDMCGTNHVIDPYKKKQTGVTRRIMPRQCFDPVSGRYLLLCNMCGIARMRKSKPHRRIVTKEVHTEAEKQQYLAEARSFANNLVTTLGDNYAERLYCPRFTSKPCRCIQTYLVGGGKDESYQKRAFYFIKLIRLAQKYSSLKCYDMKDIIGPNGKKSGKVGLGKGHKKSKTYEDFVMVQRRQLKDTCSLCEMAIKKILCYSNNFLFKKLKTYESSCRIEKVKGKGKHQGLKAIADLAKERCCHGRCTVMALTHEHLLREWRIRASQGQLEARRVIGEMLTPSGLHTNCYAFIKLVTGVTSSVIGAVSNYMRETGGCRDPLPHGLKSYWENHPKRRKQEDSDNEMEGQPSPTPVEVIFSDQYSTVSRSQTIAESENKGEFSSNSSQSQGLPIESILLEPTSQASNQSILVEGLPFSAAQLVDSGCHSTVSGAVLEAGGLLNDGEEHVELITICNPDGSTQLVKVPVIARTSLDGATLLHDFNIQIPNDIVMDTNSDILQSDVILENPGLSQSSQGQSSSEPHAVEDPSMITVESNSVNVHRGKNSQPEHARNSDLIFVGGNSSTFESKYSGNSNDNCSMTDLCEDINDRVLQSSAGVTQEPINKSRLIDVDKIYQSKPAENNKEENINTELVLSNKGSNILQVSHISDSSEPLSVVEVKDAIRGSKFETHSSNIKEDTSGITIGKIQVNSSVDLQSGSNIEFAIQQNTQYLESVEVISRISADNSVSYPPNAQVVAIHGSLDRSGVVGNSVVSLPYAVASRHLDNIVNVSMNVTSAPLLTSSTYSAKQMGEMAVQRIVEPACSKTSSAVTRTVCSVGTSQAQVLSTLTPVSSRSKQDQIVSGLSSNSERTSGGMLMVSGRAEATHDVSSSGAVIVNQISNLTVPTQIGGLVDQSGNFIGQEQRQDVIISQSQAIGAKKESSVITRSTVTSVNSVAPLPSSITLTGGTGLSPTPRHIVATLPAAVVSATPRPIMQCSALTTGPAIASTKHLQATQNIIAPQVSILPKPTIATTHTPPYVSLPLSILPSGTAPTNLNVLLNSGTVRNVIPSSALSSVHQGPISQVIIPVCSDTIIPNMQTVKIHSSPCMQLAGPNQRATDQLIKNQLVYPQAIQLASNSAKSNMVILHNASTNQRGGSFSLQHLTNQQVGSIAIEHGNMFAAQTPLTGLQLVQPKIMMQPRLTVNDGQVSSAVRSPVKALLPSWQPIAGQPLHLPMGTSAKHHLQELLPVLPTIPTSSAHK